MNFQKKKKVIVNIKEQISQGVPSLHIHFCGVAPQVCIATFNGVNKDTTVGKIHIFDNSVDFLRPGWVTLLDGLESSRN